MSEDEVIYLVMPDRFENGDSSNDMGGKTGDRTLTSFDPTLRFCLRRPQDWAGTSVPN